MGCLKAPYTSGNLESLQYKWLPLLFMKGIGRGDAVAVVLGAGLESP